MPIAAGAVRDQRMAAGLILAACDVPAERGRAAALDRAHHLQLVEADVPGIGRTPRRPMVAEDVRDLQSWSNHNRRRYGAGGSSVSRCFVLCRCFVRLGRCALRRASGLSILAIIPVATRV